MFTGHNSFGEYLHEKAKYKTKTKCYHSAKVKDTTEHPGGFCPGMQRRVPGQIVGDDLSFPAAVKVQVGIENA